MKRFFKSKNVLLSGMITSVLLSSCGYLKEAREENMVGREVADCAAKVIKDLGDSSKKSKVACYIVPPMSAIQRLPNVYPEDGELNGELRILVAKDEYEPGSFLLYSLKNLKKVELKLSKLKTRDGKIFPSKNLDLTVVKVWYQNGNGWYSYFADPGLKLTPELLLHDENLIKVDRENKANYARVDYPSGSVYKWISQPRYLDDSNKCESTFNFFTSPFADTKSIQPVELISGEFKQFFLTVHADKNCSAGIYRGKIKLVSGGRDVGEIPVAVRVLPFTLPAPKTYFDPNLDFVVTTMGQVNFDKDVGGDLKRARKIRIAMLKNQRRHNIFHAKVGNRDPGTIKDLREAGMSTNPVLTTPGVPWYGKHWGGRHSYDEIVSGKVAAKKDHEYFQKHLGHNNVIMKYADEPNSNFVAMARSLFPEYLRYDFILGTAGHGQIFNKAGYLWRYIAFGDFPDEGDQAKLFNQIGVKGYTGFYAGQHNGVENPQYVRRQHGMLSYLTNCSMIDNYEFALRTWNDLSKGLYKPMNLAYPTSDGLVDTLAWEGFREGVDDMRYATLLMRLADEAVKSDNLNLKQLGLKTKQYFALLDPNTMDLNELRIAMIQKILALIAAAKQ